MKTIRSKVTTALVVACLSSVMLLGGISYVILQDQAESDFAEETLVSAELVDKYVSEFIASAMNSAKQVALSPSVYGAMGKLGTHYQPATEDDPTRSLWKAEQGEVVALFESIAKAHPAYGAVFFGMEDGGYAQYPAPNLPEGYDPRKRPWYRNALQSTKAVSVSKAYMSTSGAPVATAVSKVYDASGSLVGVASVDMKLSMLVTVMDAITLGRTGRVALLEKDGTILTAPGYGKLVMKKLGDTGVQGFDALRGKRDGIYPITLDGKERLVRVFTAANSGYRFLFLKDMEEIMEDANSTAWLIFVAGTFAACILGILGYLLARSIVKPLNIMVASANDIQKGVYDKAPSNDQFTGELLELNIALNAMVSSLVETLHVAEQKTQEAEEQGKMAQQALEAAEKAQAEAEVARKEGVLQAANQLQAIVGGVSSASEELAAHVEQTRGGTETQAARSAETATAMEEMNAAVIEVARNASDAAVQADTAREQAESGTETVQQVVSAINDVAERSSVMKERLAKLGEQAEGIGAIMNVITDIADQTNLLALNAAIEAARAGDAGRGFAVVADEVRKLAEKTMQATKEVGDAVQAIQQGTRSNIQAMDEASEAVGRSTELAGEAGQALTAMLTMIDSTSDMVRTIATASEQQSATSEEINSSVEEVSRLAEDMAGSAVESTQTMGRLSVLTGDLRNVIETLQKS